MSHPATLTIKTRIEAKLEAFLLSLSACKQFVANTVSLQAAGTIELGCDCESALIAIFEHVYNTPSQPHHHIIHAIRSKLAVSPVTWKFQHVRGHQDKHIPFHLLDMWSQLNVEMDTVECRNG
jgi:hypothetical protein